MVLRLIAPKPMPEHPEGYATESGNSQGRMAEINAGQNRLKT
jgi:hypothetical protein